MSDSNRAQNHSFDLGNEDAEEEERRIVQR